MNKLYVGIIVAISVMLAGCGQLNKTAAQYKGYQKTCVDGVVYLQFPSGATPQVTLEGNYVQCR